ncbi:MAG TPA: GC-type dockerin domain-anchored protein, partial [Phycisphaerales bacterium]|nr:GC-type dockerin domain-anchored protein [Phycisphaerales bacterium]
SSAPVNIPDGVTTRFESSFHNDGMLTLQGSYYGALMYVQGGSVALTGGGSVLLSNHPSNQVTGDGASSTLINQSNLISGSGSLGSNVIGIINNSVIEGSGSYGLVINPADGAGLDNNATLRAADGGRLFLDGPGFDNAGGVIRAESGGTVYLRTASISGGRLTGAGTGVFVNSGSNSLLSTVSVEAPFVINDGTNLTLAGAVGVSSTMTANSSYYGATVTIQNSVTLDGGGTLIMGNHPSSLISGNTGAAVLTNSGVTIRGSGQLGANQLVIVNGPGGTMRADQAYALTINPSAGGFTNQGALQVAAGATMNIGDGGFTTSGSITVDAGGKLDKTSESFTQTGGSVHAHGEIEVDSNSYLLQGGTLGGRGLVDSNVINSGGVISPGASTGTLTIEGNLLQQESAEMHIEVGGGNTGEYDTLKVLGSASLNGVLRLTNLNGFIADPGQQFTVVNSTGVMSGTFSQIIQPTTGPRWGVAYINNSVILTAFCGADFDGTGFVDTDDFTAFVTAFEAGTDDADFDGTGVVDTDDFTAFVIAFEAGC